MSADQLINTVGNRTERCLSELAHGPMKIVGKSAAHVPRMNNVMSVFVFVFSLGSFFTFPQPHVARSGRKN